jgi:hypothetical protein
VTTERSFAADRPSLIRLALLDAQPASSRSHARASRGAARLDASAVFESDPRDAPVYEIDAGALVRSIVGVIALQRCPLLMGCAHSSVDSPIPCTPGYSQSPSD